MKRKITHFIFSLKFGFTPEQTDNMDWVEVEEYKAMLAATKGEQSQDEIEKMFDMGL